MSAMRASSLRTTRRWQVLCASGLLVLAAAGCRSFRERERPLYRKVSPAVAQELIRDNPDVLIIDLRSRDEFLGDTGHLGNARNIPLERLPFRLLEISGYRDDTFLVYCREDDCGAEGMAILVSSGFEDAILVDGGIDGWIRSGFKTVLPAGAAGRAGEVAADGKGPLLPVEPVPGSRGTETPDSPPPMP